MLMSDDLETLKEIVSEVKRIALQLQDEQLNAN